VHWYLLLLFLACYATEVHDFVILMGPPAAGKSLSSKTWWYHNSNSDLGWEDVESSFVAINVDEAVASDVAYQEEMRPYQSTLKGFEPLLRCSKVAARILNATNCPSLPGDAAITEFLNSFCTETARIYFKHRSHANNATDAQLLAHLVDPIYRKNILYESTGSNSAFGWLKNVAITASKLGFRVHLVVSFADSEILLSRAILRALSSVDGRFPCPSVIDAFNIQARKNFGEILRRITDPNTKNNASPFDSVLLLDTNSGSPRTVFFWKDNYFSVKDTRLWAQFPEFIQFYV
jgi:hypothetical protein